MLKEEMEAPGFSLPDQDGNLVSLADFVGRTVVLYFYPRAKSPGCTKQACGVRDHSDKYEELNAVVLGVSADPLPAVKKFHETNELNFTLLADSDHEVSERYGVWVEKKFMGKQFMGIRRSTFIIDPSGKVAHVIPKVSPPTHDEIVIDLLEQDKS